MTTKMTNKLYKGVVLIITSALFVALGQLFWKLSSGELNINLIIGFMFYGLATVLMIIAFKYGDVSIIHPLLSINYIFAFILAAFFLSEELTIKKLVGTFIIIVAQFLIVTSNKKVTGDS